MNAKLRLSLVLLLLVALTVVPVGTYATSPTLMSSFHVGSPGTVTVLSGAHYAGSTVYSYCLSTSSSSVSCVGASGSFTSTGAGAIPAATKLTIPTTTGGGYWIITYTGSTVLANVPFSVVPGVKLSTYSGTPGTVVTLTGGGYAASTGFSDCLSTSSSSVACVGASGGFTSDGLGNIPGGTTLTIPATTGGGYWVITYLGSTVEAFQTKIFTVLAGLTISTFEGSPGVCVPWICVSGTVVTLAGGGYAASTLYSYCLSTSGTAVACVGASGGFTSDGSGNMPSGITLTIPITPQAVGGYYIITYSGSTVQAKRSFTVVPDLFILDSSGPPQATIVTLAGAGYRASTLYSYCLSTSSSSVSCVGTPGSFTTDASGNIPLHVGLTIPNTPTAGYWIITYLVLTHVITNQAFTVVPSIMITQAIGPPGSFTTLTGLGYPVGSVSYCLSTSSSAVACVGASGSFTTTGTYSIPAATTLTIPTTTQGGYWVITYTGSTVLASIAFSVVPGLTLSTYSGTPGTVVTLSAGGYAATTGYSYCLSTSSSSVSCVGASGSFTSDGSGNIPSGTTLTIPTTPKGQYWVITYSGSTVEAFRTFGVGS